jgi:hypothetical protein
MILENAERKAEKKDGTDKNAPCYSVSVDLGQIG